MKTGEFRENLPPEKVFSEGNLYSPAMERLFNERMEREYADLFRNHLLGERIDIDRGQLLRLKRFLLMCILRTPSSKRDTAGMRRKYQEFREKNPEHMEMVVGRYISETEPDALEEPDDSYWRRTLQCVLDDPLCTPDSI